MGAPQKAGRKDGLEERLWGHMKTTAADPEGWPRVREWTELAGLTRHTAGSGLSASPLRG